MPDQQTTPASDLLSALERVYWERWNAAQCRVGDHENLPEGTRTSVQYALVGVVDKLAAVGWRPTGNPEAVSERESNSETALAAVYAAIEREVGINTNSGDVLKGLAHLVDVLRPY